MDLWASTQFFVILASGSATVCLWVYVLWAEQVDDSVPGDLVKSQTSAEYKVLKVTE